MNGEQPQAQGTPTLAIVALVLGIASPVLALVLPILGAVGDHGLMVMVILFSLILAGAVVAVIALCQSHRLPGRPGRSFAVSGIVLQSVTLLVVVVVGIVLIVMTEESTVAPFVYTPF